MGEHTPIFLFLISRKGESRSMEPSRQREEMMVCIQKPLCIDYELQYQERSENFRECWVWESWTVSKNASKGHIFKRKKLPAKNTVDNQHQNRAGIITAKGTKVNHSPCSSAGLLYLWIPRLTIPPPPSNFRGVRQETQCQRKTFHRALVS